MFTDRTAPYTRALSDGLILTSVASAEDAERLIAFNTSIFGNGEGAMTRSLIFHHPNSRPEHWLYIADRSKIVSSLVLIPWQWRYADVIIKSGEMGIVGTDEAYRKRGLIRQLDQHFKGLLRDGGFHLSHIQGIPYFYRQFGYEYTLPLESQWQMALHHVAATDIALTFRYATCDDIPTLMDFYTINARSLGISAIRTADHWQFLLEHTRSTATEAETWMIERAGQPIAYCRIPREGFGAGLIISEATRLNYDVAIGVLQWLKALALERNKPYLRFNLSVTNDLLQVARSFGAYDAGGYQWQIHVVDAVRLIEAIAPVLAQRLALSIFAGLSETLRFNLYRNGFEIHFEGGQVRAVTPIVKPDYGAVNLPPNALAPLVLGFRSWEELTTIYPDVSVARQARALVSVLFPKMEAFLDTLY